MMITLTDLSGIRFNIDTSIIDEVHGEVRAELILSTGEKLQCQENALTVMQYIVTSKFIGG